MGHAWVTIGEAGGLGAAYSLVNAPLVPVGVCTDNAEVAGSIPASPTLLTWTFVGPVGQVSPRRTTPAPHRPDPLIDDPKAFLGVMFAGRPAGLGRDRHRATSFERVD